MKKTDEPIVVEQTFNASIETVWKAITDLDRMRQWYFENIPSFEPEVGFETQFGVQSEDKHFRHLWTVTEVDPPAKIAYRWRYEEYPGDSVVTFQLSELDDETRLTLTVRVLDDFPDDIPEFRRESCMEGWHYFIGKRLKAFLEEERE